MEPFVGEIKLVSFDFIPRGWAACDGSLLPISKNQVLFSLIGVTYGGDGVTNFQLPDLRGTAAIAAGAGPQLSPYNIGDKAGTAGVVLTSDQLPSHNHLIAVDSALATNSIPTDCFPAGSNATIGNVYGSQPNAQMATSAIGDNIGGGQPHENQSPYLALTYAIALQGIYPAKP